MIRIASSALALCLIAAPAFAQDADSAEPQSSSAFGGGRWGVNLSAGTDNRSKGASKSGGDPYVSADAEWENGSGFAYAGASVETIKSSGADVEYNVVAGFRPYLAGFDLDVSAVYKLRPGSNPGVDETEVQLGVDAERSIGPASGRLRVQYAPDAFGSTDSYVWMEAQAAWAFTNRLEGSVALGKREQKGNIDYAAWNVGAAYALTEALELDVRYYDTDASTAGEQYEDALVASVSYAF